MSNLNVEYLKREDLVEGKRYYCLARNFRVGTWNGKEFEYERVKFNMKFPDTEKHWDEGAPYGTVKPLALMKE